MAAISEIAKKHGLLVIEDAAQAHGASINGTPVGTFGDAAAFSFYPTKNMTSGEGGMIVFKNSENARKARLYRNQGMEKRYQNEVVGFNLRMTDLHAAIGRTQLKHLQKWTEKRQSNAQKLSAELQGVEVPFVPEKFTHVFHQYTLIIKDKSRDELRSFLDSRGIPSMIYYPIPLHMQAAYTDPRYKEGDFPVTEYLCSHVLSLPMHTELNRADIAYITGSVLEFLNA